MIMFTIICMLVMVGGIVAANSDYVWLAREDINGNGLCRYLTRWHLFRWGDRISIYLHHFQGDDWSVDLHDHPKNFISIGLCGSYVEETESRFNGNAVKQYDVYHAPWFRRFPAMHAHRLFLLLDERGNKRHCWTLVIVGRSVRDWGWWTPFSSTAPNFRCDMSQGFRIGPDGWLCWVPWKRYVFNRPLAESRRSCP